ncbi:MAG: aldo/keto reductase, partial [Chthonomonadaceae bacterium]|nr:aldo/keto reductase [Chthonomonadaceae bacterium]
MQALEQRCTPTSGDGRFELYKVSLKFDNPETRRPHGFPQDLQSKENQEAMQGQGVPGEDESLIPH